MNKRVILAACLVACFAARANAAFINIDDSDLANITITAGDFEDGFFVNGVLLTTGLGNSASITLVDSGNTISGSWIDLGQAAGARVDLLFALPSDMAFATSGVEFGVVSARNVGTLSGSFGGYQDPTLYFPTAVPTLVQNGQTGFGGAAFLSVSFISEAAVPEPATILLMSTGVLLALRRRRA